MISKLESHNSSNPNVPKLDCDMLERMGDPAFRYDLSKKSMTHDEREAAREAMKNTYQPKHAPAWLKHDRQVLRFFAYFQEPVHESAMENVRVRQCIIHFYLEDGTMDISEPKVQNSGMTQGLFVKRHRIPKPGHDAGFYTADDLSCGTNITVYGRTFRISDCDDFTHLFYGHALCRYPGEQEEQPQDAFTATQLQGSTKVMTKSILEGREFHELALGGNRKNVKLQQFLENDRKVLSFNCFWDDPTRYGYRMYYTLLYYLADDSVEILENLAPNSGRDPFPVFWSKKPLRKNPVVNPAPGMLEPEPILYTPEDLIVGEIVVIYNREIVLYDCDEFTRDFYRDYIGHEQGRLEIPKPPQFHPQLAYPPHTGYGEPEDSLASVLKITPRPPKRNILKMLTDQEKVLRYEAVMANGHAEDRYRKFIIVVHLANDTVSVWEKRQRNSGHCEGRWAERSRKHNPVTGTWFVPDDFHVGAIIEINSVPFKLVAADVATHKTMEAECGQEYEFVASNIKAICAKIHGIFDDLESGAFYSADDIKDLARDKLGEEMTDHELITLVRQCATPAKPGLIAVDKLLSLK